MEILVITNNKKQFYENLERYEKIKKVNFKLDFISEKDIKNIYELSNNESNYLKKFNFIIFDSDTINNEYFNKLREFNLYNVIFLSQYLNWDRIIEVFKSGNIYYLKPLHYDDFNI